MGAMSDEARKIVGERLRKARIHAGHESAADAARALKLHPQNVRDQEAGRRGLAPDQAAYYAKAYKVSLDWLIGGIGPMLETTPPDTAEIIDIWTRIPDANRNAAREMLRALSKKDGSA